MTLHLIKLCVGAPSLEELALWQSRRYRDTGKIYHRTRMMPKRREELLNGGSIYWVMKGTITGRQALQDIDVIVGDDGIKRCDLVFDKTLLPVMPTPRRAFQGWRYLRAEDAPADLIDDNKGLLRIPPKMRADLAELCLI